MNKCVLYIDHCNVNVYIHNFPAIHEGFKIDGCWRVLM